MLLPCRLSRMHRACEQSSLRESCCLLFAMKETRLTGKRVTVQPCAVQIVYYDGQFDDSRLNVSLACTAALAGAAVLNYAEVVELLKVFSRPCLASHTCISCSGDMHKYPELPALRCGSAISIRLLWGRCNFSSLTIPRTR